MKAQADLMEYVVMTFLIIIVIVFLIFFLSGFQVTQFGVQKSKGETDRALFLLKMVESSQLFVKESTILDDGKLTALAGLDNACEELEGMFGKDWFFEVTVLDGTGLTIPCTSSNYEINPECNYWSFCSREGNNIAFDIPVNVYRNLGSSSSTGILPRMDLGLLKVGVYVQ